MRDFFKNILENFRYSSEKQMKVPVFVTFLSSFIAANFFLHWRPIFILLFSNKEIEERITAVDKKLLEVANEYGSSYFWIGIIFGCLMVVFYLVVIPYVQYLVNKHLARVKKDDFNVYANLESEIRKRKILQEREEKEFRELQNQNSENRSYEELLRDKDLHIQNLLDEMNRISSRYNSQMEDLKKVHSDEVGAIKRAHEEKIQMLENEKESMSSSYIMTINDMENKHEEYGIDIWRDAQRKVEEVEKKYSGEIQTLNAEISRLKEQLIKLSEK